ncbi:MAG: hypothetical protein NVSMB20_03320 [Bradyrhizobium sp.]
MCRNQKVAADRRFRKHGGLDGGGLIVATFLQGTGERRTGRQKWHGEEGLGWRYAKIERGPDPQRAIDFDPTSEAMAPGQCADAGIEGRNLRRSARQVSVLFGRVPPHIAAKTPKFPSQGTNLR